MGNKRLQQGLLPGSCWVPCFPSHCALVYQPASSLTSILKHPLPFVRHLVTALHWQEFKGILSIPHHPKAAGLTQRGVGLWRNQMQHRLGWQYLQGWGEVLQEAVYAPVSNQYMVLLLPQPGITGLGNKGWERECHHSPLSLGPTCKTFVSCSPTLHTVGLELLVPERNIFTRRRGNFH